MIAGGRSNTDLEDRVVGQEAAGPGKDKFVDIHCHCLPNLDDGPQSLEESLALCRALMEDNISLVVATPHQLGRFENHTNANRIGGSVQRLNQELSHRRLDLTVLPGAEVRLDERICTLLANGEVLTLADKGRHILLELPSDVFIDIEPLLRVFAGRGVTPILAHPERNSPLLARLHTLSRWRACGACLQLTAASIVGSFGGMAEEAAHELLARGWVEVVATDAHDAGANRPCMAEAFARIADEFGRDRACLLCSENPSRVTKGQRLIRAFLHAGQEVR